MSVKVGVWARDIGGSGKGKSVPCSTMFVCKIPLLARRTRPSAHATIGFLVYNNYVSNDFCQLLIIQTIPYYFSVEYYVVYYFRASDN